jgi:hypothetical protein
VEEKKRFKTLKSEDKPEEAMQAFKYGKELANQAATLELQLKSSSRMATQASNVSSVVGTSTTAGSDEARIKRTSTAKKN